MQHLTAALDPASQVPLYEQLYRSIAQGDQRGRPARRRPDARQAQPAEALSVSVNTVDGAYQMWPPRGIWPAGPAAAFTYRNTRHGLS